MSSTKISRARTFKEAKTKQEVLGVPELVAPIELAKPTRRILPRIRKKLRLDEEVEESADDATQEVEEEDGESESSVDTPHKRFERKRSLKNQVKVQH
jgi:transcription initiation factor TFIIIB Brf1 subunit/transcription initiation factor TFIIB